MAIQVEAFEPVPASAVAARANAALNDLDTITVHEAAISDRDGSDWFQVPDERSWSHLAAPVSHEAPDRRINVKVIALDEEIARGGIPTPDVIKIDVEGAEVAVLRGLASTLRSRKVTVICELHASNIDVLKLMTEVGYTVQTLDGTAPIAEAGPITSSCNPSTRRCPSRQPSFSARTEDRRAMCGAPFTPRRYFRSTPMPYTRMPGAGSMPLLPMTR